ncbi:unnamed protein product [Prunus armeniaca]|uniref:Uncharacterized protein n=1 Tax=Prunus armeniaca TaxID=36596 RepID=A0A6J5XJB1_PRUAR|nr:unnamed protein product [Prunus armeniaca]
MLDSVNRKKNFRRKKCDFIFTPPLYVDLKENTQAFINNLKGDGRLPQKLPLWYCHDDAVTIILSADAELRSNQKECDHFRTKSPPLIR